MIKERKPIASKFKNSLARLKTEFSNLQRNWIEEAGASMSVDKPSASSKYPSSTLSLNRPIIKESSNKSISPKKN